MRSVPRRWHLLWITTAVLLVGFALIGVATEGIAEVAHAAVRYTARISLMLFLLAFTAAAAWQCWPSSFTRWQLENRRYLGLSFALSHFSHLCAIGALGIAAPTVLDTVRPTTWVLGGLAYLFIALMAATSFDRTATLVGPKTWKWLHILGGYYIWLVFANSYVSRVLTMPEYMVPAAAVLAALGIRIVASMRRRSACAQATRASI